MNYYVYVLLDDRFPGNYDNPYYSGITFKPFYVGKGLHETKNKIKRHLFHYVKNPISCDGDVNPNKCRTVKLLKENNYEPNYIIVYESEDENLVLNIERELIKFYGKSIDGGILTNITDGGTGGDILKFIPDKKDKINKILSKNWSGEKNPNFKRPIEENFSHLRKINNNHWNKGKIMSDETKRKIIKTRKEKLPIVEMIDINTKEILDRLTTISAIEKYKLTPSRLYSCLKNGGTHKNYHWKFENKDLVILKSFRNDYIKPKIKEKINKKVFFKKNINDTVEVEYKNTSEASKEHGFCVEVIRRKCKKNTSYDNIFRYENSEYKIEIPKGVKKSVVKIDSNGNRTVFQSATEASKSIENGNISAIVSVCKGKRNTYKKYKFEYLKNDKNK